MSIRFKDQGIITQIKPFSEKKYLISIFSLKNGLIKGITNRSHKNFLDTGHFVNFSYSSRLADNLGFISMDNSEIFILYPPLLPYISSMCGLLTKFLAENHPYEKLYYHCIELLQKKLLESKGFYIWFEEQLLLNLGFGLSLEECAVTHNKNHLIYVSPKTGCAISESIGLPYHEKLLVLPQFITEKRYTNLDQEEMIMGLKLTGYFIEKHLGNLPVVRLLLGTKF